MRFRLSPLKLLLAFALMASGLSAWAQEQRGDLSMCHQKTIEAVARQEIEYLRRAYAIATDQIGEDTEASVTAGGEIYHQIFSPDVTFAVTGPETQPLTANGPKGWVDVVRGALGPLGPTQHLIGSQVVTFDDLQWNDRCEVVAGKAKMQSYVQAWHDQNDREVWLFIGTYFDEVVYQPQRGWQISHMELRRVTGELRPSGAAVAATPL
jgi:hypothetical protein